MKAEAVSWLKKRNKICHIKPAHLFLLKPSPTETTGDCFHACNTVQSSLNRRYRAVVLMGDRAHHLFNNHRQRTCQKWAWQQFTSDALITDLSEARTRQAPLQCLSESLIFLSNLMLQAQNKNRVVSGDTKVEKSLLFGDLLWLSWTHPKPLIWRNRRFCFNR